MVESNNNVSIHEDYDVTYLGFDTDKSLLKIHDHNKQHEQHKHEEDEVVQVKGCIKTKSSKLTAMLIMVFSFFFVEALVGQLTHSLTLLADSFHMLSDVLALVVGLVAVNCSKRSSNETLKTWFSTHRYSNTFGWVRFEVVGALVNSTFLLALCLSIAMEAIEKFMKPQLPTDPHLVLIVGAAGLVVNLLGLCLFGGHAHAGHSHDHHHHSHDHDHKDQEKDDQKHTSHSHSHDQMNMRAVFLHVLGDALGSVVVVLTALVYIFVPHSYPDDIYIKTASTTPPSDTTTGELPSSCACDGDIEHVTRNKWILYVDPGMSLILVVILCFTTIPLFIQSGFILMQSVPSHVDIEELTKQFRNVPGISYVHDFHVWQLNGDRMIASMHIQVKDQQIYQKVAITLKQMLCDIGIHSVTIQPEFELIQTQDCSMDCTSTDCDGDTITDDITKCKSV